jgi:hypothetical protein
MQTSCTYELRTTSELIQQALDLIRKCEEMKLPVSDELRERLMREIHNIRLNLSILRRHLAVVAGNVNRRQIRKLR